MSTYRIEQLEECHREMFGDLVLTCQTPSSPVPLGKIVKSMTYPVEYRRTTSVDSMVQKTSILENERRRASALVDELLVNIYYNIHNGTTDYNSATSGKSHKNSWVDVVNLQEKGASELKSIVECLNTHVERMGSVLVRRLKRRDALRRQQEAYCEVITRQLAKRDPEGTPDMRFTIQPAPGESGFSQWAAAMKMVAQLPGGIPSEFRRRLWLTLAEKHLAARGVDWPKVERTCFSEWSHPADAELGVQIVKDLHRTGCSLFCGEDGQENQALLKRVLLAYARWNKAVGYCQGFNMLAALILQVTDKCESDALKLMIYLIEGVLPDSYFADSLRGLSVDMAVFRELLRSKLPRLSRHLDTLQNAAKDGNRSYEPPLTNVFTMQWFLTLFCNCLPQPTVLRVWDLILLEGNEILLRTALAIWQVLADRILSVRSADEFYCIMGVLTRELLEFDLVDGNSLIKAVIAIGPLTELKSLREHYLYNINPWGSSLPQVAVEKQLKLYSRQSITLDISALKKQYTKLKQRQRQAHIIFSAAISRQSPPAAPVTMNHLLLGKSALVPAKRLGPPKGTIPPARQTPSTLLWKDAPKQSSSSSSSDTELCDDDSGQSSNEEESDQKTQIDDNLPLDSDNILMRTDNTTSAKTSASEPDKPLDIDTNVLEVKVEKLSPQSESLPTDNPEINETSDTFDTTSYTVKPSSESDDDSFDFEQFLADRVKCLKENNATYEEDESEERIQYARRNSAKALQIIQENSLILHRILQCQSRLSPSPPLIQTEHVPEVHDTHTVPSNHCDDPLSLQLPESQSTQTSLPSPDISHESSTVIDTTTYPNSLTQILFAERKDINSGELRSPEYGSKYSSILEKSKSLDERYNALILNIPPLKQSISEQRSITEICKDKPLPENVFKEDELQTLSLFSNNNLCDAYIIPSTEKFKQEEESNTSPKLFNSKTSNESIEASSPEQSDLASNFSEKIYVSREKGDSNKFTTTDYIGGSYNYENFSYNFPTETKKDDQQITSDISSLTSFPWNENPDDCISTAFNFDDFETCNIDGTDSGISFEKESGNLNRSPIKSPKYSLTSDSEFKCSPSKSKKIDLFGKYSLPSLEEEKLKSDEHSSFYKDFMSQLQSYTESSPNSTEEMFKDGIDNVCLGKESMSSTEKTSFESKYNIIEPQNEERETSGYSTKLYSRAWDDINKKPATLNVSSIGESSTSKSPSKSPSKVFNPFPVPLSSRQSKEVPLKLGLYKK